MSERTTDGAKIALAALFVTGLVTAQLLAVKLLAFSLPGSFPIVESSITVPAGVLAYAVTFVASDCYTELYGRQEATVMVNVGFMMNFVMLGLVWLAIVAPGSEQGVDPATFESVLGLSTNIVVGSLAAYLVSQNWDVFVFDRIRTKTDGRHLWLRNLGSTATSQFIDTAIFVLMAFYLVPQIAGIGNVSSASLLLQLLVGQYIIKLGIAALDTPVVYTIVSYLRANGMAPSARPVAT
ncbi:queuosine precursor transporter [Halovenus rubra]|uniref:Queuosine transporter n=2 Tax=Halovenus rubra TaxID=869890 RepID=A0ACC7DZM6_9EURY|nr:queuosine precursor transporter [Halovenus rubra]